MEGTFSVLVKIPNRQTLSATARSVWTSVASVDEGGIRFGTEIQFSAISETDREFLRGVIAKHYERKIGLDATRKVRSTQVSDPRGTLETDIQDIVGIRVPVSYNRNGKTVEAYTSRLSARGCHVHSKLPPPAGGVFSLKIKDIRSGRWIMVDSSVIASKRFARSKRWGMILRFMNLTEAHEREIRRITGDRAVTRRPGQESKSPRTKIGQVIQRYFSGKKPEHQQKAGAPARTPSDEKPTKPSG